MSFTDAGITPSRYEYLLEFCQEDFQIRSDDSTFAKNVESMPEILTR